MVNKNIFDVSNQPNKLEIQFSSTMDNIDKADEETRKFMKKAGLESETFSVCLVMREGLTNAVKHGNQFDREKTVNYLLELKDNRLRLEIEDKGEGFDWQTIGEDLLDIFLSQSFITDLEDPDEELDLEAIRERHPAPGADHGRGLIIMSHYFNDYLYNEKGNKLILTKDMSSEEFS